MTRILIVDDYAAVLDPVRAKLEAEGFAVATASNGSEAIDQFQAFQPHLVVLDQMMPVMDGLTACKRLRAVSDVPIIIVSAKSEESDVIVGLELGADDYLCKPFKLNELIARIRAVLRRREPVQNVAARKEHADVLAAGTLRLDARSCLAKVGERSVSLTPIEFRLLAELMKRPGEVLSREDLLRTVWDYDGHDLGLVCTHVKRLRAKIEIEPSRPEIVRTVRGFGYMVAA